MGIKRKSITSALTVILAINAALPAAAAASHASIPGLGRFPTLASAISLTAPSNSHAGDSQTDNDLTGINQVSAEDVTVLVQGNAAMSASFIGIKNRLVQVASGVWKGRISPTDYAKIRSTPGLRVSKDQTMTLDPMSLALPKSATTAPLSGQQGAIEAVSTATALGKNVRNNAGSSLSPFSPSESSLGSEIWNIVNVRDAFPGLAAARTASGTIGSGMTVAVIDSGIDTNALGMSGKVLFRNDLSTTAPSCTDNGFLDPFGHGTHVASIIGANDSGDVGGVAPGVKFVDLRVFNCAGSGDSSAVDSQLSWILANKSVYNIKVVNLSLAAGGGPQDGTDSTSVLVNQLVAAGLFVTVAAGNSTTAGSIMSPGTAPFATTVAAAGVGPAGRFLAPFSSMGPTSDSRAGIDVTAPGVSIRAAASTALYSTSGTVVESGTSMAAPFAAGVAALMISKYPALVISGNSCAIGAPGCNAWGVDPGSMVNQVQDSFRTQDWFAAGLDPASGSGLLDPVATLTNGSPAAASTVTVPLRTGTDTYVFIPPSLGSVEMNVLLDSPVRTGVWDSTDFNMTAVKPNGATLPFDGPCVVLASACYFGLQWNSFSPTNFTLGITDNTVGTWIRIQSQRQVNATFNLATSTSVMPVSGISIDATPADSSNASTLTLTRTSDSLTPTTYAISSTAGWLPSATSLVVPAGAEGTTASTTLTAAGAFTFGKVMATATGSFAVAGLWPRDLTGDSTPVNIGGLPSKITRPLDGGGLVYSTNGAVLGHSWDPRVTDTVGGGQVIAGLVYAPPGSTTLSKLTIAGASGGQIDAYNLSKNGDLVLMGEFPAASGVVSGDTDTVYQHFIHNMATDANIAVGPARTSGLMDWDTGNNNSQLSADGTASVISTFADSSFVNENFLWQGGSSFGTSVLLATLPQASGPRLLSVTATGATIQYWDSALGTYRLAIFTISGGSATSIITSVSSGLIGGPGTAVAGQTGANTVQCINAGVRSIFTSFKPIWTLDATSADCSWVLLQEESAPTSPRGRAGSQLVQIFANGSHRMLDSNSNAYQTAYLHNSDSSKFLTGGQSQANVADVNGISDFWLGLKKPLITGNPAVASPQSIDVGSWATGLAVAYQWLRDGDAIPGATAATYTPVAADSLHALSVRLSATPPGGSAVISTSTPTTIGGVAFFYTSTPVATGSAALGSALSASFGTWDSNANVTYGWYRNGALIAGTAGLLTYTLQAADSGLPITFRVTGVAAGFPTVSKVSNAITIPATGTLKLTPVPRVTGTARVGLSLSAVAGTWDAGVALGYQWNRAGVPITAASASSYLLQGADLGQPITVTVTGSKPGFMAVSKTSTPALVPTVGTLVLQPTPTISGTGRVGSSLTAVPATWDSGVILSYQWRAAGVNIPNATLSTYTLQPSDLAKAITVAVTGSKAGFTSVSKVSSAITAVAGLLTLQPTPSITGTTTVGQRLSAVPGIWDAGVTLTYQWTRGGVTIAGATSATYLLVAADRTRLIALKVTATKTGYTSVIKTSSSTVAIR